MFSVKTSVIPFDVTAARRRCLAYRRRILDISQQVGALHVAPAFSCLEMVDAIYHGLMRRRPGAPGGFADIFLMSKGHGCLAQYVILEELGVLSRTDLDRYCTALGRLGAHPDYGVPGIAASTGSLGHGLGIAAGMAHAGRLTRDDAVVYVVLSDGELQEGSTWEALMTAGNLRLENLVAFLDLNDLTGLDRMSEVHPAIYPVPEKAGLGVHLTLDMGGQARFGPDTQWIEVEDYDVDIRRADGFYAAIRRYWPDLPDGALSPGYAGIRPKISGPTEPNADFLVSGPAQHGIGGLVNLFGFESPGLTASMALGAHVAGVLNRSNAR